MKRKPIKIAEYSFLKHITSYKIYINNMLRYIRNSAQVRMEDNIAIQAVLEIMSDVREYGGWKIEVNQVNQRKSIKIFLNGILLLHFFIKNSVINISFIKDDDPYWIADLCRLADAHYKLYKSI